MRRIRREWESLPSQIFKICLTLDNGKAQCKLQYILIVIGDINAKNVTGSDGEIVELRTLNQRG